MLFFILRAFTLATRYTPVLYISWRFESDNLSLDHRVFHTAFPVKLHEGGFGYLHMR